MERRVRTRPEGDCCRGAWMLENLELGSNDDDDDDDDTKNRGYSGEDRIVYWMSSNT
jgi:hypothetical protein